MSRQKKSIIILFAVIAVLAAGIGIINNVDMSDDGQKNVNEEIYTIYSEDTSKIDSVNVTTGDSSIKAVNLGDSVWTINEISTDDIDVSKAQALAGTVATLTSKHKVDDSSHDLSQYGLQAPKITVTITKKNGEEDKLYIGDMSPTLGEYFVMLDGDSSIYTIYSFKVDTLCQPLSYYQEFDRFNIEIDDIRDIIIERSDETIDIKLIDNIDINTNNVWEMVSPYRSGANDDYIDNKILEPIDTISLTSFVEGVDSGITQSSPKLKLTVRPYDNTTGKYGDEYTEELRVGRTEGAETYVEYKGRIYRTPKESVDFVKESSFNIVSKLQALVDISKVKSVLIEYDSEKHTMDISHKDNEYIFRLDGKETNNDISREIYKSIMALAVDSVYKGDAINDEVILRITFDGIKSENDTVVEIKSIDDINCALIRNGEVNFTIKRTKIDNFINLFKTYTENPMSE
ncbi:MAG: DUF4340 domain-containing protein [Oscillospiraceae bacterium]|nr:DUF4340 domain-containing protein [Oscillospiraceae bacterium]